MGVEGVNLGSMATQAGYADMMREFNAGEKPSSAGLSINADSTTTEGAARGSGTGVPFTISQRSNSDISDLLREEQGEVVEEVVETDAAASELLDEKLAEEGQPKV